MFNIRAMLIAGAACGLLSSAAQAGVVFSDDFNSYPGQLNWQPPANWTPPPPGTVDLIGETPTGTSFDYFPGNGGFVDLNGSNGIAGTLQTITSFGPGQYTVSFSLGGNTVGPSYGDTAPKTTTISLGDWSTTITLNSSDPLTPYSFTFTTAAAGSLVFTMGTETPSFPNLYIGNILDNVQVTAVPEASTWAMMILGFAGIGFLAFRRQSKPATLSA